MSDESIDDIEVVARIRLGDREAYAMLVRKYQGRVRGYCANSLINRSMADDAAQEIFLKAYRALDRFRGDASFSTWLFRIAVNHCKDCIRKSRRHLTDSLDELLEDNSSRAQASLQVSESVMIPSEQKDLLTVVLSRLKDEYREVLLLREHQGMSYAEIAQTCDTTIDSVKAKLRRARKEVAKIMMDIEEGNE